MSDDDARYRQAEADLRQRIQAGEFPIGGRLPSLRELGERFNLSGTQAVRNAYMALMDEGIVEGRQGAGYFLVRIPPAPPATRALGLADIASQLRGVLGLVDELRSPERLRDDAIDALTRIATESSDFSDALASILRTVAANVGGVDALIAGRPGSWESEHVHSLASAGSRLEDTLYDRTRPVRIVVNLDELLNESSHYPYSDLEDNIIDRYEGADTDDEILAERHEGDTLAALLAADRVAVTEALQRSAEAIVQRAGGSIPVQVTVVTSDDDDDERVEDAQLDDVEVAIRDRAIATAALPAGTVAERYAALVDATIVAASDTARARRIVEDARPVPPHPEFHDVPDWTVSGDGRRRIVDNGRTVAVNGWNLVPREGFPPPAPADSFRPDRGDQLCLAYDPSGRNTCWLRVDHAHELHSSLSSQWDVDPAEVYLSAPMLERGTYPPFWAASHTRHPFSLDAEAADHA